MRQRWYPSELAARSARPPARPPPHGRGPAQPAAIGQPGAGDLMPQACLLCLRDPLYRKPSNFLNPSGPAAS